jgi:hypothetical protein
VNSKKQTLKTSVPITSKNSASGLWKVHIIARCKDRFFIFSRSLLTSTVYEKAFQKYRIVCMGLRRIFLYSYTLYEKVGGDFLFNHAEPD